LNNKN